jgi:hypothetical protein
LVSMFSLSSTGTAHPMVRAHISACGESRSRLSSTERARWSTSRDVIILRRRHRVNKQGQCHYCGRCWRFWQKQPQCTVYWCVDFALRQPLDVVRWRLRED